MSLSELMIDIPAEHERNVFGQFDAYAKKLERTFHVTLIAREGKVKILGEDKNAEKARRVLDQLAALSKRGNEITEQNVDYAMSLVYEDQEEGDGGDGSGIDLSHIAGKTDQTEDAGTEALCRCHSGRNDHVWAGTCGNRKDLSCHGYGDHSVSEK